MGGVATKTRIVAERRGEVPVPAAVIQAPVTAIVTPRRSSKTEATFKLRPYSRGAPPGSRAAGAPTGFAESRP